MLSYCGYYEIPYHGDLSAMFYCDECLDPCRWHDTGLCPGCRERRAETMAAEEADMAFDFQETSEGGVMH